MKKNFRQFLSLLLLYPAASFSQTAVEPVYELFDSAIHIQNTDLANGTEYVEQHIIQSNDHKYFQTMVYLNGNVVYNGQPYYKLDLQYNVYDDLLLTRIPTAGGATLIQLHKENVQAFNIDGHSFIALKRTSDEKPQFYEILLEGNNTLLLKKHRKKIKKHLDQNFTYFEFKEDTPEYFVAVNDIPEEIESQRSVSKLFPNKEEQIQNFYRSNSPLKRANPDKFFTQLFQSLIPSTSELNHN
ncbi:hypothetical protein JRG66_10000 [Salinimicrobium tongyeongense]|uniref:DUF4369 domain-containing protein n=1 Tax=Salinimicrobium tongyeongense TaxID=2809707 RepID=A0ABY6NN50_9FLAO|nr:hypothetical protein [Salinimicrobium tongyeongense]UZH54321.1 hypothetical protein JRG66_10000 [Salinimicrobium tongyeongense]